MKRFEIWAEFPDGCEAKVDAMNAANRNDTACGYGFPHGVPAYTIRVSQ